VACDIDGRWSAHYRQPCCRWHLSFGLLPVKDKDFWIWFTEQLTNYKIWYIVSWRFVNGDEFAPIAPPRPVTVPEMANSSIVLEVWSRFRNNSTQSHTIALKPRWLIAWRTCLTKERYHRIWPRRSVPFAASIWREPRFVAHFLLPSIFIRIQKDSDFIPHTRIQCSTRTQEADSLRRLYTLYFSRWESAQRRNESFRFIHSRCIGFTRECFLQIRLLQLICTPSSQYDKVADYGII
jgi:hypothetical protein